MIEIMPIDLSTPSGGDATFSPLAANGETTFPSLSGGLPLTSAGSDDNAATPSSSAGESTLARLVSENAALGDALRKIVGDFEKVETRFVGEGCDAREGEVSAFAGSDVNVASPVSSAVDTSAPALEATLQTLRQLVVDNGALGVELEKAVADFKQVEFKVVGEEIDTGGAAAVPSPPEGPVVLQAVDSPFVPAETTGTSVSARAATDSQTAAPARAARDAAAFRLPEEGPVTPQAVDSPAVPAGIDGNVAVPLAVAAPADVPAGAALVRAADAVAETILVTPELARGQGEIRIQLQPDVLGGSTVSVAVTGRQIEVTFIPATHEIAVLLAGNQSVLAAQLATRIRSFNVTVDVRRTSSYDSEEIA